jgi:hypothetical protein
MQRGAADLRAEVVPLTSMWPSEHAQFNSLARLTAFAFKEYPLRPMRDALERSPFLACPCIGAADSAVKGETVTTSSKCMPLHPFNYIFITGARALSSESLYFGRSRLSKH